MLITAAPPHAPSADLRRTNRHRRLSATAGALALLVGLTTGGSIIGGLAVGGTTAWAASEKGKSAASAPRAKEAGAKSAAKPVEKAARESPLATTRGDLLQLGLFATRGDAEWALLSIRRQLPAIAETLTTSIDPAPTGGGIVLRARVPADGDGVCRELLRARFGCFVVRDAGAPAPTNRTPLPAVKPSHRPDGVPTTEREMVARADAPVPAKAVGASASSPITTTPGADTFGSSMSGSSTSSTDATVIAPSNGAANPIRSGDGGVDERAADGRQAGERPIIAAASDIIPREKPPEPGTETVAAGDVGAIASTITELATPRPETKPGMPMAAAAAMPTMTITKPIASADASGDGAVAQGGERSVAAPVVSAPPIPPIPPNPVALTGGGVLSARTLDGFIRYSTDDAKVLAEIERRTRRRGRIGAVLPSGGLEVTPAILTQPEFNICALTFDDGPHRTVTKRILEILTEEKVIATYFPVGNVAVRYPELIRDWVAAGHEIGNHSYTHGDLRAMKPEVQRHEIAETNRILRELGATSILFRPPYGRYNQSLLEMAREEGSETVLWNVDTRDWKVRDPDKIVQHVTTAAGSGSVLLLHSTYPTTAEALPRVIQSLRAKNCEFVTLSDWIARMRAAGELPVTNASLPLPRVAHARN